MALPFGTNQLHESDLRSFIPQRNGCPLGKDLTVADGTRLAIENVEEIFLQGFAASPRFARECAASGLRDAVNLEINPNTVVRAYKELEIRGLIDTHHGTGTFVGSNKVKRSDVEHQRQLNQIVSDFIGRAGAAGFTVDEVLEQLEELQKDSRKKRK